MIKVSKRIPIPATHRKTKYPWAQMKVGYSFTVPKGKVGSLYSLATRHKRNTGTKYVVKVIGDKARCWRVK